MSLFTEDQIRELIAEFPDKPVRETCAQIDRKSSSINIASPVGLAKSWLKKSKPVPAVGDNGPALPARGTFDQGGHWLRGVSIASEWEQKLVTAARDIRRGFMSPAEAVMLLTERGLQDMCRPDTLAIWSRFENVTNWPAVHCSTSAEQWVKTYVVGS